MGDDGGGKDVVDGAVEADYALGEELGEDVGWRGVSLEYGVWESGGAYMSSILRPKNMLV